MELSPAAEVFLIKVIKPVEQLSLTTYVASTLTTTVTFTVAENNSFDFTYARVTLLL